MILHKYWGCTNSTWICTGFQNVAKVTGDDSKMTVLPGWACYHLDDGLFIFVRGISSSYVILHPCVSSSKNRKSVSRRDNKGWKKTNPKIYKIAGNLGCKRGSDFYYDLHTSFGIFRIITKIFHLICNNLLIIFWYISGDYRNLRTFYNKNNNKDKNIATI